MPAANRLDLAVNLSAPGDGFVAGLAGIDRPLNLVMGGRGTWANWRGRAVATLGGETLGNVEITARDGTFTADGLLRPALMLTGPVQRLAEPAAMLHATARMAQRRADLRLRFYSRAFAAGAEGRIDLGGNRFEEFRVAARLLRPGAIAPDLSGQDVRLALVLDGPFARPEMLYNLSATRLTMAGTTLHGLRATGHARVRSDDIVVPVRAWAARIDGLDAVAGGTIANVTLAGEIGITGTRLVSDNMFLRSDRIDARLALAFDLARGRYLAALQGRVDNYLVDGVGLFAVNADLDMTQSPAGFGLRGRIAARTRRITNETVQQLLGGVGTVTAGIDMDPAGVIRISNIRLVGAPASGDLGPGRLPAQRRARHPPRRREQRLWSAGGPGRGHGKRAAGRAAGGEPGLRPRRRFAPWCGRPAKAGRFRPRAARPTGPSPRISSSSPTGGRSRSG